MEPIFRQDGFEFIAEPTTIFDPHGQKPAFQFSREPLLRRMPDGSLVCFHYTGGPTEPHDENVVAITRSTDDGQSWSPGEVLFRHEARGTWATEFFTEVGRPRVFVHTLCASSHYTELKAAMSFGDVSGAQWSAPAAPAGVPANFSVRRGVVLADGTWLFPIYWQEQRREWNWTPTDWSRWGCDWWQFCCGCLRSTDAGATFSLHGYIHAGPNLWEPNVIETAPNRLFMLMRAEGWIRLYRSDSTDGGMTWSAATSTAIPSANSKVTLLKYGDAILLLHNPAEKVGVPERRSLELWISRDAGKTWPERIPLVRSLDDSDGIMCYPDGFIDSDRQMLYLACDSKAKQYLLKLPLKNLGLE